MKIFNRPLLLMLFTLFYGFIGFVIVIEPFAFLLMGTPAPSLTARNLGGLAFTELIGFFFLLAAWGFWTRKNIVRYAVIGVCGITLIHYLIQFFQGAPKPIGYLLFLAAQIAYLLLPGIVRYFKPGEPAPVERIAAAPPTKKKKRKKPAGFAAEASNKVEPKIEDSNPQSLTEN